MDSGGLKSGVWLPISKIIYDKNGNVDCDKIPKLRKLCNILIICQYDVDWLYGICMLHPEDMPKICLDKKEECDLNATK